MFNTRSWPRIQQTSTGRVKTSALLTEGNRLPACPAVRPHSRVVGRLISYHVGMVSRGSRRPPEERRQQIIDAAVELADTVGLDRLTSRDVAAELGIAPGLVHHYFGSMDGLVVAAFHQVVSAERDEVAQAIAALPPLPALCYYIARELDGAQLTARVWMSAWVAAPRRPELAIEIDRQMLEGLDMLTALLQRGVDSGVFRVADPRASAFRILVLIDGILVQVSMRAEKTYGDVDSLIWETVEREVGLPEGTLRSMPSESPPGEIDGHPAQ